MPDYAEAGDGETYVLPDSGEHERIMTENDFGIVFRRITRDRTSLCHLVNAIAELEAIGVAFISFRDNPDLTTASVRLMVSNHRQGH